MHWGRKMEHPWKVYLEMYISMASWSCIASAPAPPLRWWSWHGMWHSHIPLSAPCPSPPCRPWDGGGTWVHDIVLSCRCCLCSVAVARRLYHACFPLSPPCIHATCLWISTRPCCTYVAMLVYHLHVATHAAVEPLRLVRVRKEIYPVLAMTLPCWRYTPHFVTEICLSSQVIYFLATIAELLQLNIYMRCVAVLKKYFSE